MYALTLGAKRAATRPAAKRAPAHMRRGGRKELTTITADPLMADPALTAVAPLLTFDVTAPDGLYAGAFQGSTPEDAILSYVATLGYASIDDAAMAMGFADAATYLSAFSVTETLSPAGMDPALAPVDPLAAPAALSRRGRRPCFVKMGASVPIVDSMPAVDPGIVSGVVVTEATLRRYRAVVSRTANATAVVEFDAYEDEDLYKLAEALVPQIPAEAWSVAVDPNSSWGYIDRIEPLAAAADPALTTLSRRGHRRFAQKGAYMVAEGNGPAAGPYEAATPEEAVGLWIAELGYGSADDAAAVLGYDSTEAFLANVIATEAGVADPAATLSDVEVEDDEDEETPAEIARRRRSRKSSGSASEFLATAPLDAVTSYISGMWFADTLTVDADGNVSVSGGDLAGPRYLDWVEVEDMAAALGWVAPAADPQLSLLSARSRKAAARRLALKATFIVADATTGDVLGTYDATTSDDAILSYCAEAGYESVEAAAAGMGFATVDEFLASISVAEGAEAEPAPAETPAETLSRRHRLSAKAAFDIADPVTGEILGTYDAGTIDDAILSYAASLGFASADEAAAAAGITVEEWLATFTVTEAVPAVDAPPAVLEGEMVEEGEDEEEEAPAEVSRRRR